MTDCQENSNAEIAIVHLRSSQSGTVSFRRAEQAREPQRALDQRVHLGDRDVGAAGGLGLRGMMGM